ncbi:130_t:CDS:1 [Dentiscutata heterogama]|uniref:130_t:CDS:1 n=2 Tax=Dentiscutata TaxID=756610 RepID=A0ACA9PDJ8_9GLOM|nr:130_t:CDS:1 [Dentiscutata heterogama]
MEDSGPNSPLESEQSNQPTHANKNNKRGRPKNLLWNDHFTEINRQEGGHRGWKCNYCNDENSRASDMNMNTHLALTCQSVPLNIRQDCLRNFPAPNKRKKIVHDIVSGSQP